MAGGAKAVDAIDQAVKGGSLLKINYVKKGKAAVKMTKMGNGSYLSPWKRGDSVSGNGLFFKPYGGSGYIEGSGLFSGTDSANSPVRKVPILGSIPIISNILSAIM